MDWTTDDREALLALKDCIDFDDIHIKEGIKKVLLNNKAIIHVLNNKELEEAEAEPDDYFNINILPYYIVQPTQTKVSNFVCYEVQYRDIDMGNKSMKNLQIVFYILCEQKTIRDEETGIARHDLLAALIQNDFNFTNYFGKKIKLISDVPSVVDMAYACRTLTFEQYTDNNLVKTSNGIPRLANKDVVYFGADD